MNWFNSCSTPDDVRAEYRRLAKLHHPDLGGNTRTMQEINAAYEVILKGMSGRNFARHQASDDGRTEWAYRYDERTERELRQAIDRIMVIVNGRPGITVSLVGLWLWVVGDTRPVKDQLKAAGCYWNRKRAAWNWKPAGSRSYYNANVTLDDILAGGIKIEREARPTLSA